MCIINITWFFILFFIFSNSILFFFCECVALIFKTGRIEKKIHNSFFLFCFLFVEFSCDFCLNYSELSIYPFFYIWRSDDAKHVLQYTVFWLIMNFDEFFFFFPRSRQYSPFCNCVYAAGVCICACVCVCGSAKIWIDWIRWFYFFPPFVPLSFWKKTNSFINYYVFFSSSKKPNDENVCDSLFPPPPFHALLNIYLMTIWYYYFSFSLCPEITNRRIRGVEDKLKKMKKKDNKILKLIT